MKSGPILKSMAFTLLARFGYLFLLMKMDYCLSQDYQLNPENYIKKGPLYISFNNPKSHLINPRPTPAESLASINQ